MTPYRHRRRLYFTLRIGLLVRTSLGMPVAADTDSKANAPLRILLTNDGGWNAVGSTAVYDALTANEVSISTLAPEYDAASSVNLDLQRMLKGRRR